MTQEQAVVGGEQAAQKAWQEAMASLSTASFDRKMKLLRLAIAQKDLVHAKAVLDAGAHPFGGCAPEGLTPLIDAIVLGDEAMVALLIDSSQSWWKLQPDEPWKYWRSALDSAVEQDQQSILVQLLASDWMPEDALTRSWDYYDHTGREIAVEHGAVRCLAWLLNQPALVPADWSQGTLHGKSIMYCACRDNQAEMVALFLEHGCPLEVSHALPKKGCAMMVEPWHTPLSWAMKHGALDVCVMLHARGARFPAHAPESAEQVMQRFPVVQDWWRSIQEKNELQNCLGEATGRPVIKSRL